MAEKKSKKDGRATGIKVTIKAKGVDLAEIGMPNSEIKTKISDFLNTPIKNIRIISDKIDPVSDAFLNAVLRVLSERGIVFLGITEGKPKTKIVSFVTNYIDQNVSIERHEEYIRYACSAYDSFCQKQGYANREVAFLLGFITSSITLSNFLNNQSISKVGAAGRRVKVDPSLFNGD